MGPWMGGREGGGGGRREEGAEDGGRGRSLCTDMRSWLCRIGTRITPNNELCDLIGESPLFLRLIRRKEICQVLPSWLRNSNSMHPPRRRIRFSKGLAGMDVMGPRNPCTSGHVAEVSRPKQQYNMFLGPSENPPRTSLMGDRHTGR